MNWTMVSLRGLILPLTLAGCGFLVAFVIRLAALNPLLGKYIELAIWVGPLLAAMAWGVFALRLWRWEYGKWHECQYCSGPLGWLRMGRIYYGKQLADFRRCYNCGRATREGG
jgi:hypothetical protein